MEKNRFLTILVILLVLLNLGTLGYLFVSSHQPPPVPFSPQQHPPFAGMLQKELGLNNEQAAQVGTMHEQHVKTMDSLDEEYVDALHQYFDLLRQDTFSQGQRDSLATVLSRLTIEKADAAFDHFYNINTVLTAEQAKKYKDMLPKILEPVFNRPKNNAPPPKD